MPGPEQITDRNPPRENVYDNICGEVNNQNLHGYYSARDNMNLVSGRNGSYQSLVSNDQVFNSNGARLDLNSQRAQGGFSSCPTASQTALRPRVESNSIDFSQSLTQILSSLGNNLNENPKEGFASVSA